MTLLATQADFEMYGHLDVTAEPDASIIARLESASARIESYCHRVFASGTVTNEVHDGGTATLFLRQPPVESITTVVENSVTLAGTDYMFYPDGRLVRVSAGYPYPIGWYGLPQIVVVTYVGGFDPIPADVRDTCVRMAARGFEYGVAFQSTPAGAGALTSITLEGSDAATYAVTSETGVSGPLGVQLTDEDKEALDPYRILNLA